MNTPEPFQPTPEQIDRFKALDFEGKSPGTVVRDFDTLLNLIGEEGVPVTPSHLFNLTSSPP